ncbi:hypothetical protein HanIR_Chr15g0747241 [Helianthus annuus]|nr:hypothetical protein HanIR_Chr15g0747241 [Helianthus annuus]
MENSHQGLDITPNLRVDLVQKSKYNRVKIITKCGNHPYLDKSFLLCCKSVFQMYIVLALGKACILEVQKKVEGSKEDKKEVVLSNT